MKNRTVRTRLCASCAEKLGQIFILHEVPERYRRAGYGRCEICDFRGSLSEYTHDPERDRRSTRAKPEEKEEEYTQGCMFSAADFGVLDEVWDKQP